MFNIINGKRELHFYYDEEQVKDFFAFPPLSLINITIEDCRKTVLNRILAVLSKIIQGQLLLALKKKKHSFSVLRDDRDRLWLDIFQRAVISFTRQI